MVAAVGIKGRKIKSNFEYKTVICKSLNVSWRRKREMDRDINFRRTLSKQSQPVVFLHIDFSFIKTIKIRQNID